MKCPYIKYAVLWMYGSLPVSVEPMRKTTFLEIDITLPRSIRSVNSSSICSLNGQ